MNVHKTKYTLGDTIYLITDPDQQTRMITGIMIRPHGAVYECSLGSVSSDHYEIEISKEIDQVKKLS